MVISIKNGLLWVGESYMEFEENNEEFEGKIQGIFYSGR
jgi:hypothetical protein